MPPCKIITQVERLTERIPHPVGTKARMQAKISGNDRSVTITATAKPASAIMKDRPWINRSNSWKLTDIFWLKVNTFKYGDKGRFK